MLEASFGALLLLSLRLFSDTWYQALRVLLFLVLFGYLPALVLLDALLPRWRLQGVPFLLALGFAPAAGMILLLPCWIAGAPILFLGVPLAAAACLWFRRELPHGRAPAAQAISVPDGLLLALGIFGAPLLALATAAVEPVNPHFLIQAAIAAKIEAGSGFRPENPLVADVPLAYNYAAHVWLAALARLTDIAPLGVAVYLAPVLLLVCSSAALAGFLTWAGASVRTAALAVFCVYWYVGWPTFGSHLFARAITWSAMLVMGPLMAFPIFFVLAMALSEWTPESRLRLVPARSLAVFLLVFAAFGARAAAAPIVVAALAALLLTAVARREPTLPTVAYLASAVAATAAGFVIFLGYGSQFDASGFTSLVATPFAYLATADFLWLPGWLVARGLNPILSGAIQFLVFVALQAGLLTPFLFFQLGSAAGRNGRLETLLWGAALGGLAGVFFLQNPGGSQFTFLHYTTLALTALAALGVARSCDARRGARVPAVAAAVALALLQAVELPRKSFSSAASRLGSLLSGDALVDRRCTDSEADSESAADALVPAGSYLILPERSGSLCERLALVVRHPRAKAVLEETLRGYTKWESPAQQMLRQQVALMDEGIERLAASYDSPSFTSVRQNGALVVRPVEDARNPRP